MSEMGIIKEIMKDHDKQILHYEKIKDKLKSFKDLEKIEESDSEMIEESDSKMMMEKIESLEKELKELKKDKKKTEDTFIAIVSVIFEELIMK